MQQEPTRMSYHPPAFTYPHSTPPQAEAFHHLPTLSQLRAEKANKLDDERPKVFKTVDRLALAREHENYMQLQGAADSRDNWTNLFGCCSKR
jgi:hypothetical protein